MALDDIDGEIEEDPGEASDFGEELGGGSNGPDSDGPDIGQESDAEGDQERARAMVAAADPKSSAGKHIKAMIAAKLAAKAEKTGGGDEAAAAVDTGEAEEDKAAAGSGQKRGKRKRGSKGGKKQKKAKTDDGHVSA